MTRVLLATVSLSSAAAAQALLHQAYGDSHDDRFGWSVSGIGDVDHDGFDDFIVGAPEDDDMGSKSGSARIFSGKQGVALHTFHGTASNHRFGDAVSGAGDVNGDGFVDILIGASGHTAAGTNTGCARVFSGKTGQVLYSMYGGATWDMFGFAVGDAGDVNQDGFDDCLVGAHGENSTGTNAGRVRIFSGQTGAVLLAVDGNSASDQFGFSVSRAGDVNGDGFEDVVVGAPGEDKPGPGSGGAFVFSSKDGAIFHTFHGVTDACGMGLAVSGAGDVNGDGFSDVIAGAPNEATTAVDAGCARVYSGSDGAVLHVFAGQKELDILGYSVSGAGDVNGDGFGDVVVGVPTLGYGSGPGSARVYSGKDGTTVAVHYGESGYDWYGASVSCAGDVNGDGFDDVIAGARYDDSQGATTGSAWVSSGTCGSIVGYGSGCPGSGSVTPSLSLDGCATPAGIVGIEITQGLGGASAFFVLGFQTAFIPLGGSCTLNVYPTLGLFGPLPLAGTGAGQGSVAFPAKVPLGVPISAVSLQAFVLDPGATTGYSNTNGVILLIL